MRFFNSTATLEDVVKQRRNDVASFEALQQYKVTGRDQTGIRSVPTSQTNVVAGDKVGDYLYDVADNKMYRLINNSGTPQWIQQAIVTSFTNP